MKYGLNKLFIVIVDVLLRNKRLEITGFVRLRHDIVNI